MDDFDERLAAAKAGSLAQHLIRSGRLMNAIGLRRTRTRFGVPLREAHVALFAHIDLAGSRVTAIAERAGVSKQAVAALTKELVVWGVLEQVPDPADGRARLLRFPTAGGPTLLDGMAVLAGIEQELRDALGADRIDALTAEVAAVADALADLDEADGG